MSRRLTNEMNLARYSCVSFKSVLFKGAIYHASYTPYLFDISRYIKTN